MKTPTHATFDFTKSAGSETAWSSDVAVRWRRCRGIGSEGEANPTTERPPKKTRAKKIRLIG